MKKKNCHKIKEWGTLIFKQNSFFIRSISKFEKNKFKKWVDLPWRVSLLPTRIRLPRPPPRCAGQSWPAWGQAARGS